MNPLPQRLVVPHGEPATFTVSLREDTRWRPAAAVLLVVFSLGLTHRGGGHMRIWTVASGVLAAAVAAAAAPRCDAVAVG